MKTSHVLACAKTGVVIGVAVFGITCGRSNLLAESSAKSRIDRLDKLINEFDRKGELSGSLYIRFQDGTIYQRGVRLANDEQGTPNKPGTLVLISSVSKNYTAAAILKLEEMGRLSVSDPVSKFFPEYPEANLRGRKGQPVRLHHLLNHTSGIPDAYDDARIDRKLFRKPITMTDIIAAIKTKPLESNPGEKFLYSNTGYILLGEIIRRVSGESFGEFAKENLFAPLGLDRSFIGRPHDQDLPFALPYEKGRKGRANYIKKYHIKELHISDVFTDGNIVATAKDVANWAYDLGQQKLLSSKSLEKMFRDYGAGYGYGWDVENDGRGGKLISHNGGWVGYASYVAHDVRSGATLAYLLNQEMPERQEDVFQSRLKAIVFAE